MSKTKAFATSLFDRVRPPLLIREDNHGTPLARLDACPGSPRRPVISDLKLTDRGSGAEGPLVEVLQPVK